MIYPWHATCWQNIENRFKQGRLPHALLLSGPHGLYKRAFATQLMHRLVCDHLTPDGVACGQCRGCRLFMAGNHPDIITVGLEENKAGSLRKDIVVAQIRALSQRLSMASQYGGWQVVLIDPADAMNTAAANALLKTLEEPVDSTIMILVGDEPWRFPATIRSRCQQLIFRLPTSDVALSWLKENACEYADEALNAANGNPGLALELARDGLLDEYHQVARELAGLMQQREGMLSIIQRWTKDDKLTWRLQFAATWIAHDVAARTDGKKEVLSSTMTSDALTSLFTRVNEIRDQLRGPLRADLMLARLFNTLT